MMKYANGKFAVLVVSCDKYSDLWSIFFRLFKRFWPDCPFSVYLISNYMRYEDPSVISLPIGEDSSWSDNLIKAVKQVREEYVLLFLDDLLLCDKVDTGKVNEVFYWIVRSGANYVRMNPSQKPDKRYNELVGIVSKGTIYRTSTILSVWKKETILDLLKPGETAWDFEIHGTVRSDRFDSFYSTYMDYFPVVNGVIKAKWHPKAIDKLKSIGEDVKLGHRKVMTASEVARLSLKEKRSFILNLFPARYRRKIKDIALRGRYNYRPK